MPPLESISAQLGDVSEIPVYNNNYPLYNLFPNLAIESPEVKHEETPEERRARHHRMCGSYVSSDDIKKGSPYEHIWLCRHPDCEKCNERRGAELRKDVLDSVLYTNINIVYLPNSEETDVLLGQIGKENYRRLPGKDRDTILINAEHELGATLGKQLTYEIAASLDYKELALRVEGRKKSGSLGKKPDMSSEEGDDGEKAKIAICTVSYECVDSEGNTVRTMTREEFRMIRNEAILATADLRPNDAASLNLALIKLAIVKAELIRALGFQVYITNSWVTRKVPLLSWGDIREKLVRNHTLLLDIHKQEQETLETRLA